MNAWPLFSLSLRSACVRWVVYACMVYGMCCVRFIDHIINKQSTRLAHFLFIFFFEKRQKISEKFNLKISRRLDEHTRGVANNKHGCRTTYTHKSIMELFRILSICVHSSFFLFADRLPIEGGGLWSIQPSQCEEHTEEYTKQTFRI